MPSADAERFPLSPAARFLSRLLTRASYAVLHVLSSRAISLGEKYLEENTPGIYPGIQGIYSKNTLSGIYPGIF